MQLFRRPCAKCGWWETGRALALFRASCLPFLSARGGWASIGDRTSTHLRFLASALESTQGCKSNLSVIGRPRFSEQSWRLDETMPPASPICTIRAPASPEDATEKTDRAKLTFQEDGQSSSRPLQRPNGCRGFYHSPPCLMCSPECQPSGCPDGVRRCQPPTCVGCGITHVLLCCCYMPFSCGSLELLGESRGSKQV